MQPIENIQQRQEDNVPHSIEDERSGYDTDDEDLLVLINGDNGERLVVTVGWGVPRPISEFEQFLTREQMNKLTYHGRVLIKN